MTLRCHVEGIDLKLVDFHSHQNGFEWIKYHRSPLWDEIVSVIESVDAEKCRTKRSKEKRKGGRMLYSPIELNQEFKRYFEKFKWNSRTTTNYLSTDRTIISELIRMKPKEQLNYIKKNGIEQLKTNNQTDFIKDKIAVEVQLGKYSFVAHDLFVKHMSFYLNDDIDVGVEIVPMKEMEREMSSGVPYYERDLFNLMRQGRGIPQVPIVLIGIAP